MKRMVIGIAALVMAMLIGCGDEVNMGNGNCFVKAEGYGEGYVQVDCKTYKPLDPDAEAMCWSFGGTQLAPLECESCLPEGRCTDVPPASQFIIVPPGTTLI